MCPLSSLGPTLPAKGIPRSTSFCQRCRQPKDNIHNGVIIVGFSEQREKDRLQRVQRTTGFLLRRLSLLSSTSLHRLL